MGRIHALQSGRIALIVACAISAACGAGMAPTHPGCIEPPTSPNAQGGRPPLAFVIRDGDARGAVAVAVSTEGIAPDRGALVGVSLAELVQERLAATGVDVTAVGGFGSWQLRALVASPAEASTVIEAVRTALLTPVTPGEPALAGVARKAEALALRPLADRALIDRARCTGGAFGIQGEPAPTATELESWRAAAHGVGRVALATAGDASVADAASRALDRGAPWPRAVPIAASPWPTSDAQAVVYEASGEIAPGAARIEVTARTATPERAVAIAPALGDAGGPLASRLAALDAPGRVRSVIATAHSDGGCVAVTIDLGAEDLASDASARIATAAALARQEIAVAIAEGTTPANLSEVLTREAADPRDAAERAAWWSLAGPHTGASDSEPRLALTVGVAAARDASTIPSADVIRTQIERATSAWHVPVVDARTEVERGQGEVWILLASPCGSLPEAGRDAGLGEVVAMAAAAQARERAGEAKVEPFVDSDAVGLLVHGPARPGESPLAHARRLADVAARAFAADKLEPSRTAEGRAALLSRAIGVDTRALGVAAEALAPDHPSWLLPQGTMRGLSTASDDAIAMRAAALREGPLRVAILANTDAAQANAAARAVDRWIARRPGESRACPALPELAPPRGGTYAVDLPPGAPSEALLALPIAPEDESARTAGTWMAAVLGGTGGLLARALGEHRSGIADAPGGSLAIESSAWVMGSTKAQALFIRVVAPDAALDGAVAQVRTLLDRLRHGALTGEDRMRAGAFLAQARLAASLDPRVRIAALFRGDSSPAPAPSLAELQSFAQAVLRDEALVIVAARPSTTKADSKAGPSAARMTADHKPTRRP